MNDSISLAFSVTPASTTAVLTVTPDGGNTVSLPIASVTGGADETAFFSAVEAAIAAYRSAKGI
jgi:hypothetical protein